MSKFDAQGRIVIPKSLRELKNIEVHDPIEIFVDEESVILRKYIPGCIFCSNMLLLRLFKESYICENCIQEIANSCK